jgi:EAL domain-containing protein (putative c-di-GMP-specific phosphodiesterase class I)
LRWKHPTRGNVPPDVFIPVAEETGLIGRIGDFVIADACETASRWPKIEIAINASAIELRSETYALRVTTALERYGVDPRRLEIELTESALVDSSGQCERNIAHLRALGLRIALDDFGTGFSSFSRLQHIEVDRIKIDKSFIDAIGTTGGNPAIVRAMIALAHGKGLKTTAEGVETSDQRALLQALGCDQLQGYLLSKPLAKDHFAALMEDPDGNLKDPDGPSGKREIVS